MKMARYLATTRSRFGRGGRRLLQAEYVNRSDVRSAGNSRSQKSRRRVELRTARVANCDDCDAAGGNNGLMKMPEDDDSAAAEEERETLEARSTRIGNVGSTKTDAASIIEQYQRVCLRT